jgi:GT2 family glycosyltransferase
MTPDVSILLVSWNTRDLTLGCLDVLPAAVDDGLRFETIVVDNGSCDGTAEALAERSGVELIRNSTNLGFAAAVNQAYARARGGSILLLNSDVRVAAGALSTLARFLRETPEAAGVAARYVNADGSPQAHYYRLPSAATAAALTTQARRLRPFAKRLRSYRMLGDDFSRARPVPQPSASCLLLRRSCLHAGPLLDERYPIFFNDVELARSLASKGHALWMTPDAVAIHELGASTRLLGPARARQHLGSLTRYLVATEPRHRVALFRALVVVEGVVRRLLACEDALPLRDLRRALAGDPGRLPQVEPEAPDWVVYLSGIPWNFHRNRQQELARELARTRRVLFVERPRLLPAWRVRVEELSPSLWRAESPALLPFGRFLPPANAVNRRFAARRLRHWLDGRPGPRLLWIDEDLAAAAIGRLGERAVVYDAADLDWTFTRRWNRPHLRRALAGALRRADLVLSSSRALSQLLEPHRCRPVELTNACDPERFHPDGPRAPLGTLPRPRLGYVGAIDERAFDAPLLAAVATLRPDWSFLLAGPSTPAARSTLGHLSNVHLLGPVASENVPSLLRAFDVCLIPYRTSGRASYVHPKKFYEYLATGKPVVATPLAALDAEAAVHGRGSTPEAFARAVEGALAEAGDADLARRRRTVACANSWASRGERLRGLLAGLEGAAL